MMAFGWWWFAILLAAPASAGLTLRSYENSGFEGTPNEVVLPDTSRIALHPNALSGIASGMLALPAGTWNFSCAFESATLGFVWVDGHLVCQTGAYDLAPGSGDDPLPVRRNASVAFRAHLYGANASARVLWGQGGAALAPIPAAALDAALSRGERLRDDTQRRASRGWGHMLHRNMLTMTKLPAGVALTTALCRLSTGACVDVAVPDGISRCGARVRPGPYAIDRSYGEYSFGMNATLSNVSVAFSVGDGGETLRATYAAVGCGAWDCSDFALRVSGRFLWAREGSVAVGDASVAFAPAGLARVDVAASRAFLAPDALPPALRGGAFLPLDAGFVTLATTAEDAATVLGAIVGRGAAHRARTHDKVGDALVDAALAVEAAASWTAISTPAENGFAVLMPVSRAWSRVPPADPDFSYAIFDWDNLFASLLAAVSGGGGDDLGKAVAYSNVIQSFKAKAAGGYLANCAGGGYKDQDRSEPPVGAKVLLELHDRYGDDWLVDLLFDDCLDWSDWVLRTRVAEVGGLPFYKLRSWVERTGAPGGMQEARYESGLDDSPMYDCATADQGDGCDFFDRDTGFMELADVGMTSMAAQEAYALATLAERTGRAGDARTLRARGDAYAKAVHSLWDDARGVYANRVLTNASLSRRISPTSFYPLMVTRSLDDGSDTTRATALVDGWLTNETRFCVKNRSDRCYWGLPSIAADDDAYAALGYWRGFTWGPMALLTYWSLAAYDDVPAVRAARGELAAQMGAMVVNMWRLHGHICENYLPHKNGTEVDGTVWPNECTGTTFYHWGALAAYIGLVEAGHWA